MPDFERLQFYYGRSLTVADLQSEQQYFLEKLRLHTRCFHGMGIVCGLGVTPVPSPGRMRERRRPAAPRRRARAAPSAKRSSRSSNRRRARRTSARNSARRAGRAAARIRALALRSPSSQAAAGARDGRLRLGRGLRGPRDHRAHAAGGGPAQPVVARGSARDREGRARQVRQPPVVELTICYCEQQTYPSRPIVQDNCDLPQKCKYGRVREGYRFRASLTHQPPDTRCSNCCDPCENECVVLARISLAGGRSAVRRRHRLAAAPRDQRLSTRGHRRHQLGARRELRRRRRQDRARHRAARRIRAPTASRCTSRSRCSPRPCSPESSTCGGCRAARDSPA